MFSPDAQIKRNHAQQDSKTEERSIMQELAIAQVPMQEYRQLYTSQKALTRGTLFSELDFPFEPEKGMAKGGCGCGKGKESTDGSCICG
jgi:hypothetical protein